MTRPRVLSAAFALLLLPSLLLGQEQQTQQGPGDPDPEPVALNPVFNDPGKSWLVRYGTDPANGNARQDLAVQIRIQADGTSTTKLNGTLYRYDGIKLVNLKPYYKLRTSANGKLTFDGETSGWDANEPRKPVKFNGERLYQGDNGDIRKLRLFGTYHSGTKVTGDQKRSDDRLILTIVDQLVTAADGGAGGGDEPQTNTNVPTPATPETGTVFIARYVLHPCEEEPDVDILEETGFDEEPPVSPEADPNPVP